jgi:hypothetical protein
VLVFDRTEGYVHASIPFGDEALVRLGEKTGAYTANVSAEMAAFSPASLASYDAVSSGGVMRPLICQLIVHTA